MKLDLNLRYWGVSCGRGHDGWRYKSNRQCIQCNMEGAHEERISPFKPVAPRLLSNVRLFGEGCWEWIGTQDRHGYGRISVRNRVIKAHIVSYRIHVGPTNGKCVLHKCDNPSCINPEHLWLGSFKDNTQDMLAKGRNCKGMDQHSAKLTEKSVKEILASHDSNVVLAACYGVNRSVISRIRSRKAWGHVTP
jgi:HNH endonuclease